MRAILTSLLLFGLQSSAQPLSYSLVSAEGPSPRVDGTVAYDPSARRLYLFGGQDSEPRNDLWVFSLATRRWEEIAAASRPPARFGHTLVFDPSSGRLIVFGGQSRGFFNDVWAFDIAQSTWRQIGRDDAGPSRRYGHSAIYDGARNRMIVSHGFTNSGRFDDTWAFDLAANTWRDLNPQGTRPLRRCLHHAVADPQAQRMYLYGGCASGAGPCPLGDLWSLDLNTNRWTEHNAPSKPPAREHYGMAFDSMRNLLVLFGGFGGSILGDTWEYDPRPSAWSQPVLTGDRPTPRFRMETAYAADRGTVFFFGGSTDTGKTNELWMLGPGFAQTAPQISREAIGNAFSGESGAVAPGEIVSVYGTNLGPVEPVSFNLDPLTGRLPVSGPGLSAAWNGIPAPLYFAASGQINMQVPYELAGSEEASLQVTVLGQASQPVAIRVLPTHPGLFPRIWNADGSINSTETPASSGGIVVFYATGQGITNPASRTGAIPTGTLPEPAAPVTLTIGGVEAELLFRGQAPGTVGVMQINARVPEGLNGTVPVVLTIGGRRSQSGVMLAIR
jgi:uncharacterized protein (TIGR03437 family)